jgi:hypothetical protein
LIEDQHRLAQLGIESPQLVHQHACLRMLAAQAQHRCAGHVGMVDVTGKQTAQRLRVLARAAATALVGKKANAVEVLEDTLRARMRSRLRPLVPIRLLLNEPPHVLAITVRAAVTQFLFQRLSHPIDVAVLAEYERHHQPVIARAHLAIRAVIAQKAALSPREASGTAIFAGWRTAE